MDAKSLEPTMTPVSAPDTPSRVQKAPTVTGCDSEPQNTVRYRQEVSLAQNA
jgi:hypothetical protein